jgi:hypothetical protein
MNSSDQGIFLSDDLYRRSTRRGFLLSFEKRSEPSLVNRTGPSEHDTWTNDECFEYFASSPRDHLLFQIWPPSRYNLGGDWTWEWGTIRDVFARVAVNPGRGMMIRVRGGGEEVGAHQIPLV